MNSPGSKGQRFGLAGRLLLSLFFLAFLLAGAVFEWLVGAQFLRELQARAWPSTTCTILSSSVERDSSSRGDYRFQVRYRYSWQGQQHESSTWRLSDKTFSDITPATRLTEKYAPGQRTTCHVHPDNPAQSVLEFASLATGLILLFPLIFIGIGLGGLIFVWRQPSTKPGEAVPISSLPTHAISRRVPFWFFVLFGLVSGLFSYFLVVRPAVKIIQADSWPEVECVVESSRVRKHDGDDGPTYSVDIVYRYKIEGREYRANRYDFLGGSSSGRQSKQEIIRRYPPGQPAVCYVNPHDPYEAVLHRGFTPTMWFGLIPLSFLAVGLVGAFFSWRKLQTPGELRQAGMSGLRASAAPGTGPNNLPRVLRPKASPLARFLGLLFFALFWNGLLSVFLVHVFEGFQRGRPEWFLALFMIPFVLVGVGFIVGVVFSLLALFNPRPRLTLSPGTPVGGEEFELNWIFSGAAHRIQNLRVVLEGRESASYRRGTSNTTDTSVFARQLLVEPSNPMTLRAGQIRTRLDPASLPSFKAPNNALEWFLMVQGRIPHWPDVREEFSIPVLPAKLPPRELAMAAGETEPARNSSGSLRLGVRGGRRHFHPGETLEGVAGWSLPRAPGTAEVRLFWFTRGKGTQDVEVVQRIAFARPNAEAVEPFRFVLPESPWSFDGQLVAVVWAVELVVEKESVRWEFVLGPTEQPMKLDALPPEHFKPDGNRLLRLARQ